MNIQSYFQMLVLLVLPFQVCAELPTHMAQNAQTLQPGKIGLEPYPGANPLRTESDFLERNSLSVGILPRWQVGTVPRPWVKNNSDLHMVNVTTKVGLIQGSDFGFSVGLMYASFDINVRVPTHLVALHGNLVQPSLNFNYQVNEDWDVTYNTSSAFFSYKGEVTDLASGKKSDSGDLRANGYLDHVIDFRYAQTGTYYWVFGLTRNYDSLAGMFDQQLPIHGGGASFGWIMTRGLLSMVSLGLHYTERREVKTLFGLSI